MPRTNPARYVDPVRGTRTIRETGRLVGCGSAKVYELIETSVLQAVRVGNRQQPTVASIELLLGKPIEELERALSQTPKVTSAGTKGPASEGDPRV